MRCTFSATIDRLEPLENARTRSRASAGGRPRTCAASSARAAASPLRPRMAATRSSSPPAQTAARRLASRRISPTSAPSPCTSSRNGSCLGGKWMSLRFTQDVFPGVGLGREIGAFGRAPRRSAVRSGARITTQLCYRAMRCAPDARGVAPRFDVARLRCRGARGSGAPPAAPPRASDRATWRVCGTTPPRPRPVGALDLRVQRRAPEVRRRLKILGLAVDDESGEAALVHG